MKTEVFKKKILAAITGVLHDHTVPLARAQEMALDALKICESSPKAVSPSDIASVRERYPELSV
jgi:hypothetical protein